ncbi:MAG: protein translocase subunit SecF [Acidobacteria bacterium]|nr:protein translocase subunit SecF [Acidobacteriota bacterium]
MQIFKNPNYNFVGYRWHAITLSLVVILAGLVTIWVKGLPLGVEFSGGSSIIVQFDQVPGIDRVRNAVGGAFPGGGQNIVVQSYGSPDLRQIMIRVPQVGVESGTGLSEAADAVERSLKNSTLGRFTVVGREIVGPVVGQDLTRKGIWATVLSLTGILAYIAVRFRLSFAVGAIVATIHDLLVMLAFLAFFRYDLSLNVIAAVLTIIGYSVNDTVVIFDRVRENLKGMRKDDISTIVNVAVNQTLGRTIITAGTALLSVVALFLFGGEVLRAFSFTMIVGIISGTYSTVFIAAAVVTFWRRRTPARVPVGTGPVAQAARSPQTARTKVRTARNTRPSK